MLEIKYNVIYADPPWEEKAGRALENYQTKEGKQVSFPSTENTSRDLIYPTMTVEEIKALPVKDISDKDAHLYLWTTNHFLPFAFEVIKAWGFKYSTTITWEKTLFGGGLGGAFKISTEFLLFARKGKLIATQINPGTNYRVKRPYENGAPKHSKKPYFFHQLIEQTSPGKRIELFAREQRGSWDVWGNQIKSSIELTKN